MNGLSLWQKIFILLDYFELPLVTPLEMKVTMRLHFKLFASSYITKTV